jgi:OsmC-like protein
MRPAKGCIRLGCCLEGARPDAEPGGEQAQAIANIECAGKGSHHGGSDFISRMERDVERGRWHHEVVSGAYEGPFTFASRFESGPGTNPEELIGAAHAGCFSMFLSALLTNAGFKPTRISTTATVHLGAGPTIELIG